MSDWWESRPGKLGGQPCFTGTRITVAMIRGMLDGMTPEQVRRLYPCLSLEQIEKAREPIVEACGCPIGEGHRCDPPFGRPS